MCNPNNAGWVVADTTNLAGGAVDIGGIALETAVSGGASVQVLTAGYCPPEVIGALSGTGDWVTVGSTGALSRSSAVTAATVGKYQSDGGVIVDLSLQSGGAVTGNATAIQGVSVTSASGARSYVLAGDGTNIRSRRGTKNALDYGAVGDGSTDDTAALQLLLDDLSAGEIGFVPRPPSAYLITEPILVDEPGTTLVFEGELIHTPLTSLINVRAKMSEPHGTGAAVTAYGNGGSGSNMMTLTLGAYTGTTPTGSYAGGSTCKRVLAADANDWIGRWISIPTAVGMTAGVGGEWQITGVPSNDTITVQGGASAADTGLHWRINIPAFILCAQSITLAGLCVAPFSNATTGRSWCGIEINYPSHRTSALTVADIVLKNVTVNVAGSGSFRHGFSVARSVVPLTGVPNSSTNGAGVLQTWNPTQVDTIQFHDCGVWMPPNLPYAEAAFEHCSASGQSRDSNWWGGNFYARHPYLNPSRGSVGSSGQLDFHGTSFSTPSVIWTLGGANTRPRVMEDCYSEAMGRVLLDRGAGSSETIVSRGGYGFSASTIHPSGCLIETASAGPFSFLSQVHASDDTATSMHLAELSANQTTKEQDVRIAAHVRGATTFTGVRGRVDSTTTVGGLLRFAGTETFGLTIDGAAASFTCSQANFNTACGFTVDLNWIQPWQLMLLIQNQQSGSRCWADADGYRMHIETATQGTGGSIQVTTNTTMTVWPAFSVAGLAQQQISKDTAGLVTINRSAGSSTDPAAVRFDYDVRHLAVATDTVVSHERFRKRYYSVASGGECLESVTGLASRSTRVRPKNLNGSIDISGASTEGAVSFATNEDDTSYRVLLTLTDKTGAPLSRSVRVKQGTKAVGGFTAILDAAPGGADVVTVEWLITR